MATARGSVLGSRALPANPAGTPRPAGTWWARVRAVIGPIAGASVVVLGAAVACQSREAAPVTPSTVTGATIRVQVAGAVQAPGVYELRLGDRVAEAVRAAGGTTPDADEAALNLAQRVHDEQRLDVPTRGMVTSPGTGPAAAATGHRGGAVGSVTGGGAPPVPDVDADLGSLLESPTTPDGGTRIDLNLATVAQLEKLPGIGTVSARRIVAWRTEHGPVRTVADLRAAGLSAAILRKALPYLAIG